MRYLIILTGFTLTLLISCKTALSVNNKSNTDLLGVWVLENYINNLYYKDSTDFGSQPPIIADFKKNGDLILKKYGAFDSIYKWSMKSDSIVSFNNIDFTIHTLDKETLTLIEYNRPYTYLLFFRKPQKTQFTYDKAEIENILLSNIWTNDNSKHYRNLVPFEYFDNGTMVYRYKMFDRNLNDTIISLQIENWKIAEYENYFFIYGINDWSFSTGSYDWINQIIDITPEKYTLSNYWPSGVVGNYYAIDIKTVTAATENVTGRWKSPNSLKKVYRKHLPELESGRFALFEGDLYLDFTDSTVTFQLDTLFSKTYNWQLSKDGRIIILEFKIDEPDRKGTIVECADIIDLSDDKLKLILFEQYIRTGKIFSYSNRDDNDSLSPLRSNNTECYILNMIQDFERVK